MTRADAVTSSDRELHLRLLWFRRLRWIAAAGLGSTAIAAPLLGCPELRPGLLFMALFVAFYNAILYVLFNRSAVGKTARPHLHAAAIAQIMLDLSALVVTVHLTGGMQSPALPFFVFHMAIGTILLSTRTMYSIALLTCAGLLFFHVAELQGRLPHHSLDALPAPLGRSANFNLATLVATLFGTVYLTGTVTARNREHREQLERSTAQLRENSRKLQRALDGIKELERRKSHYMRISAHQLRSPLGTIKTSLEVLTDGYLDPASERGMKLLRGAVERTDNLLMIVNDLLELAKIREGQAKAPWTREVDMGALLAEVVGNLQPAAEKGGIDLRLEPGDRAILDWGVPPDLRFAFQNIIQNAVKYSEPGDRVRVILTRDGDLATVRVEDEGIGIPADIKPDIFLEFVRAPNAKQHAAEGTGLGLSIAREAIDIHGGDLDLASEEGVGTTVIIELNLRNTLNTAGQRVGTGEIEDALTGHPAVAEAAVLVYPDDVKGLGIHAFVRLAADATADEALQKALRVHIRSEVGPLAAPDRMQWVSALPRTKAGQLARDALRKIAEGQPERIEEADLADPRLLAELVAGSREL